MTNQNIVLTVTFLLLFHLQSFAQTRPGGLPKSGIGVGKENQLTAISKAIQQKTNYGAVSVNVRADSLLINVADPVFKKMSIAQRKTQAGEIAKLASNTINNKKLTFPRGPVKKIFVGFYNSVSDGSPMHNEQINLK
jgi:hypothetical protein